MYFVHTAVDGAVLGLSLAFHFSLISPLVQRSPYDWGCILKFSLSSEPVCFLRISYIVTRVLKIKNPSNLCELQTQANRRLQPMQSRVSHYQSRRPVSTSWAPTATAGAPPPGRYSNLLTASHIFLQFRHLSADFTVSARES